MTQKQMNIIGAQSYCVPGEFTKLMYLFRSQPIIQAWLIEGYMQEVYALSAWYLLFV